MGTVYLGEHLLLGRRAAIKTLLPTLSSHRDIVDRFFNEARAISAISDPGVVQIFDFGYHVDGTAYIVMEYLEGESLATRLERLGRLPVTLALRIARQIAQSLGAAHARGIIHRDLKPGNVFLIHDPEAQGGERTKILDFGICKLSEVDGTVTQSGTMIGTPVYMSPEQCRGNGRIDHRSDIYSVGCALYHMLTGHPPFRCDSVGDFIAAHLKEEPQPPSELVPGLPLAVDALVMRCLEKVPANRFQTMGELHTAIERALAMLSDQQSSALAIPVIAQTPLGEGFRSAYNVNVNSLPTMDDWFVDSLAPVTASPITTDWGTGKPRLRWVKRVALAIPLFVGLAAGLLGTSYAMKRDDAPELPIPTEPAVAATEEPTLAVPAVATAHEIVPAEPVEEPEVVTVPPPEPAPVVAKLTRDAPKTKPARPPRPHTKKPPRPRRIVAPAPDEDLYETR